MNTCMTSPTSAASAGTMPMGMAQAAQPVASVRQAVFVDPVSLQLLALAQRVAQADVTTLLVGPTGAGKDILARVMHEASPRRRGPFVAVN